MVPYIIYNAIATFCSIITTPVILTEINRERLKLKNLEICHF